MSVLDRFFGGSATGQDIAQITASLPVKVFTYEELAAATNDFSPNNRIVWNVKYKGVLSDGTPVEVKTWVISDYFYKQFRNELEFLSRVHHKNIRGLIGCCITPNKLLTVHEFVSGKSLWSYLRVEDDQNILDWAARVKIAYSCAKALAYLHDDCNPRIVHRNVISSNILVDSSFESKLCEFTLAKVLDESDCDEIAGKTMYMDPENFHEESPVISKKVDIFFFGVVLLELIMGNRSYDFSLASFLMLLEAVHSENYSTLVDPRLSLSNGNYILKQVKQMLACAVMSLHPDRYCRPAITEIVRALEGVSAIIVPDKEWFLISIEGILRFCDDEEICP